MSSPPTLVVRRPAGWAVQALSLALPDGTLLEIAVGSPASPDERLPGATRALTGDREVWIARSADATRLYTRDGEHAWLGVLGAGASDAAVAAAAGLLGGARTELATPVVTADYSLAELGAAAELAGLAAFPGMDGARLTGDRERRDARRALAARGTVVETEDGRLGFNPREGPLLACALDPAALLDAEHGDAGGRVLVAWTPATSVVQTAVRPGVLRLTGFPSFLLPGHLAALAGPGGAVVRMVRRGGRRIDGHELRWAGDPDDLREWLAARLDSAPDSG